MLFLIINLTIGRYYPHIVTQFIIGCVMYIFLLYILSDYISDRIYEKYKYHALLLLTFDVGFLIYKAKYGNDGDVEEEKKIHLSSTKIVSLSSVSDSANKTLSESVRSVGTELSDGESIFSPGLATSECTEEVTVTDKKEVPTSETVTIKLTE